MRGLLKWEDFVILAHCCALFLCHLGCEVYDDQHKYPMSNNRDHLVGQLTIIFPPFIIMTDSHLVGICWVSMMIMVRVMTMLEKDGGVPVVRCVLVCASSKRGKWVFCVQAHITTLQCTASWHHYTAVHYICTTLHITTLQCTASSHHYTAHVAQYGQHTLQNATSYKLISLCTATTHPTQCNALLVLQYHSFCIVYLCVALNN